MEHGKRTTRPSVERPAVHGSAFELAAYFPKPSRDTLVAQTHGTRSGHPRKRLTELPANRRAKDASRGVDVVGAVPHLRGLIAACGAAETHRLPEIAPTLQQQPRRPDVRQLRNRFGLLTRESRTHVDLTEG